MPSNRELTEEEIKQLEDGGGVKEETAKERERLFAGLEGFILSKGNKSVEELLLRDEGRATFSGLWSLYFWTLGLKTERDSKKPKLGYMRKIKSALTCFIQSRHWSF